MITQVEQDEIRETLKVIPMNHSLMVLVPVVAEATETGIIKGDSLMEEESKSQEAFLTVIAVSDDCRGIEIGDRVFAQGTVTTFTPETMPAELDVAPDGYTIGVVNEMYIKMKI